jgi:hypothetical protein
MSATRYPTTVVNNNVCFANVSSSQIIVPEAPCHHSRKLPLKSSATFVYALVTMGRRSGKSPAQCTIPVNRQSRHHLHATSLDGQNILRWDEAASSMSKRAAKMTRIAPSPSGLICPSSLKACLTLSSTPKSRTCLLRAAADDDDCLAPLSRLPAM